MTRLTALAARLCRAVSRLAARVGDWLEPRQPEPRVESADPEGDAADRAIGVLQLREALRRYSPAEERAQA